MSNRLKRASVAVALLLGGLALLAGPAAAQTLDELRRSGAIGEKFDGYAVVHDQSAADTLAPKVTEINAKRRTIYEQRAADQGVSADQVGRVYAQQIYTDAPVGTWFLKEDGSWLQKE